MAQSAYHTLRKQMFAPIAWAEYSPVTRQILLNDKRVLARLNFNGQNDLVCSYLFENPYRIITLDEIEANATREPLRKTLHEFVRAFGFSGTLRQLFFDVSKRHIYLRKEILETDIPLHYAWTLQNPTLKFEEIF